MSQFAAETLDKTILDTVFENIKPVRQDINIIRGLTLALDAERFVRLRKVNRIDRINIKDDSITEGEDIHYFVDLAGPHKGQMGGLIVVSSLWSSFQNGINGNLVLNNPGSYLHYFSPEERKPLKSSEEVFSAYDKFHRPGSTITGKLEGWSDPDIHTSNGIEELAALVTKVKDGS